MTSKEALKYLLADSELLYCEHEEDIKFYLEAEKEYNIVLKDLDRLEKLEKENELLKLDNQDLHNQIKKNVKEHYKEFMEDYDCLLEEYHELYKVWEKLKKVIEILKYKLEIAPYHNKILDIYSVDFLRFDPPVSFNSNKKEYELLKEVLDND